MFNGFDTLYDFDILRTSFERCISTHDRFRKAERTSARTPNSWLTWHMTCDTISAELMRSTLLGNTFGQTVVIFQFKRNVYSQLRHNRCEWQRHPKPEKSIKYSFLKWKYEKYQKMKGLGELGALKSSHWTHTALCLRWRWVTMDIVRWTHYILIAYFVVVAHHLQRQPLGNNIIGWNSIFTVSFVRQTTRNASSSMPMGTNRLPFTRTERNFRM